MDDVTDRITRLRENYENVKEHLPWLDMSVWEDEHPAFEIPVHSPATPFVKSLPAEPSLKGKLQKIKNEGSIKLLRFSLEHWNDPVPLFPEMAGLNILLTIQHTDMDFAEIGKTAGGYSELTVMF